MKIATFSYLQDQGWSIAQFPPLNSPNTLVMVFGGAEFFEHLEPFSELEAIYPDAKIIGCSTSGEILGASVQDHSLVVAVVKFDQTEIRTATAPMLGASNSQNAGESLAEALPAPDLRGVFVLSDGLQVNGSDLVKGMNSVLPKHVVMTGGLAGDGDRFSRTWIIKDGRPQSGIVSAVGFYGQHIRIGHGSKGGWDIFGPERVITRAKGNVLYELDGKPALDLYKAYLGEMAEGLPATGLRFPLALRETKDDEKQLVRTILAVDEKTKSMTFAGDVPTGYLAQLMRANFDHLVDGAEEAALMTRNRGGNGAETLAIAVSCVRRRMVLGERTEDEVEATMEILPNGTRQIGFYSYGELSPYASGTCDLHNQTMTLTTLHEAC
ncbi:MAG: FIST N-terminal domain-containing protein [Pseudomonadota bacterium]|nr:FIST N-terminal domain-containing protein [Pseudomonadota bacterium]